MALALGRGLRVKLQHPFRWDRLRLVTELCTQTRGALVLLLAEPRELGTPLVKLRLICGFLWLEPDSASHLVPESAQETVRFL